MKPSMTTVPPAKPQEKHLSANRSFQGIPGICRLPSGRLFATWYGGGCGENQDNFVMLVYSDDDGASWSDSVWVVDPPPEMVRAYDPALFVSPEGRLFWFWSQAESSEKCAIFDGSAGVWMSVCDNVSDPVEEYRWSVPVRITDGIMMNKPTVLDNGDWALPVSVWGCYSAQFPDNDPGDRLIITSDGGKTFSERGRVLAGEDLRIFSEHYFYQLKDQKTIRVGVRTKKGCYCAESADGGISWSELAPATYTTCNSRSFVIRLASGRLLAVFNDDPAVRRNMTAALSGDDGATWTHKLLLDPRQETSYPDIVQAEDGTIYIIHDHARYQGGYILVSRITERDIEAGRLVDPASYASRIVSHTKNVQ